MIKLLIYWYPASQTSLFSGLVKSRRALPFDILLLNCVNEARLNVNRARSIKSEDNAWSPWSLAILLTWRRRDMW
jgi:hypothetical protein